MDLLVQSPSVEDVFRVDMFLVELTNKNFGEVCRLHADCHADIIRFPTLNR